MWHVDTAAAEAIAVGAGILGTGGGGNPYLGKLHLQRLLREGAAPPTVVAPEAVPDDALIVTVGGMGAPTVGIERLARGDEWTVALRTLERHLGRQADYLVPGEIGGANATRPLVCAIQTGLPVIDGDGMGRAFPELQMKTFSIYGVKATLAARCDVRHNMAIFPDLPDTATLERYARAVTIQMGGHAGYAFVPMDGAALKRGVIPHTMILARDLGGRCCARGGSTPIRATPRSVSSAGSASSPGRSSMWSGGWRRASRAARYGSMAWGHGARRR